MQPLTVTNPPDDASATFGRREGGWWHEEPATGRIVCDLCPRACSLKDGDRGFCFVRENSGGRMILTTYGLSTGFCVDPIEKKPLAHFYPGTSVLSFGTAGCNLGCKFCQNWSISKSRAVADLSERAGPEAIAESAQRLGCRGVAFTYNDPVIWAEYAIECAQACRRRGIKTVAVTAGYISPGARAEFFGAMDAANVDLKAFTERFYRYLTLSHLEPVLDTLRWIRHESDVWLEITDLLIPGENDSPEEIDRMCGWIAEHLGPDVPLHFTAFHPDFRMTDHPATPPATLIRAREQALAAGLNYVYVGNVFDRQRQSTHCPKCHTCVIERDWHALGAYRLEGNRCANCGHTIPGRFDREPGDWGRKRMPVRIADAPHSPAGSRTDNAPQEGPPMEQSATPAAPPASHPTELPRLDAGQRRGLLRAAAKLVEQAVALGPEQAARLAGRSRFGGDGLQALADAVIYGVFVSLKNAGRLRACCGNVGQSAPLADALCAAAVRSATADRRFPSIDYGEIGDLDMEVWLLHCPRAVLARGAQRLEHVTVGRHGVILEKGPQRGLLLPGVAVEAGMDAHEFLEAACRKAQLAPGSWKHDGAQLSTFEGESLAGRLRSFLPGDWSPAQHPRYVGLLQFVREIWQARACGGQPSVYWSGAADGEVAGVILSARDGSGGVVHFSELAPAESMPLQATLYRLADEAADEAAGQLALLEPRLVILKHAVPHSMPLGGDALVFNPSREALYVECDGKRALVLPPQQDVRTMFQLACRRAGLDAGQQGIMAWTFQCISLKGDAPQHAARAPAKPRAAVAPSPTVQPTAASGDARPAARAGQFYPAQADELHRLVDSFLPEQRGGERWPAMMVPHAGLIYSGRIAGATFGRVALPPTIVVIGPKHTPYGVPWAIEPHAHWSMPGGTVAADPELAATLAAAIPGLQLDAAAHQMEHAIEVELPFIHRLAPKSKVVGIALGAADLDDCRAFARALAEVVRKCEPAPLLVISSDMNHFAPEPENRRLDRMAIDAMLGRDPDELFHTVRENNVSMCGMLPAVIVMQTLRNLNLLSRAEMVDYTTSAQTSGDSSRVVGYCGMLLG